MEKIRVKFMSRGLPRGRGSSHYRRMLPNAAPVWGNCRFLFDVDETNYDWLVVYHDIPRDNSAFIQQPRLCPKERTILVTMEPSSVTVYGSDYVRQFGTVLTSQEPWALSHPNVRRRAPGLLWYYAYSYDDNTALGFDELKAEQPCKTSRISMMCSKRTGKVTLHTKRRVFADRLQRDIEDLEIYGHGVRRVDDKAEALRPYEFHIVVENHVAPHHLTEKMPDAFLGYTLPFYHGAPNASEYFPRESFIPIDISNYEASRDIILSTLANNEYHDRLPYIREARRRVMEEMNMFAVIENEVSGFTGDYGQTNDIGVIYNRRTLRLHNPLIGVKSLSEKVYVKTRNRLTGISL